MVFVEKSSSKVGSLVLLTKLYWYVIRLIALYQSPKKRYSSNHIIDDIIAKIPKDVVQIITRDSYRTLKPHGVNPPVSKLVLNPAELARIKVWFLSDIFGRYC
jgi:TolB-like protein